MHATHCPDCGAREFYVKDPEDQYSLSEFELINGEIVYRATESDVLVIHDDTETFCNRCAWHDKFKNLKRIR